MQLDDLNMRSLQPCQHFEMLAGANMITAETGPLLSAFLAEWDESRQKSSVRSAQVSSVNTDIWMEVQQAARVTVKSYEGSMLPIQTTTIPAYQWDE